MEMREEMKSKPSEKVQEDLKKTNQEVSNQELSKNPRLQQQQGTNICNGHLIVETFSLFSFVALFLFVL